VTHLTGGRGIKIKSISETREFVSTTVAEVPIRMISLNLSFSFGKQDNVKVKKSRKGADEDNQLNSKSAAESMGSVLQM
jgi:hypothetical protein